MLQRFTRRVLPWAIVLVMLLALFAAPFARAEWEESAAAEEEADEAELEEEGVELDDQQLSRELGPHPDIQTFVHFPNNPDMKFSQGEEVVVMVGFHNGSPQHYYNVSHIGAQFHSPFDFSYYIQNFTVREMETIVGPGQEATIEYRFKPDSLLEPIEFQLSGWVIYNGTDNRVYQSTFVNQTIELLEKREPWTISGTFSSIMTLAVFVVAGYYGYQFLNETGKPVKAKKKIHRPVSTGLPVRGAGKANKNPHEAAAAAASSSSDTAAAVAAEPVHVWTADNVYTPSSKSKAVRKSSSKKASKKAD